MKIRRALLLLAPACLLAAAMLASCAGRAVGYGLVLWAENGSALQTGQVVTVVQESTVQDTYLVRLSGGKQLLEVPRFRIRLLPSREQAAKEAEIYAPYVNLYGYSERDGLPLREQPDQEAKRLYKLAEGQLVKVVSRQEEKVEVAGYEDYWYLVLTEDGGQGYCYGVYLPVFEAEGDPKAQVAGMMARDPMLDTLVGTAWRPEYFQEMVEKGRLDLQAFGPDIGFFVDAGRKELHLVTDKSRRDYDYSNIEKAGPNRYVISAQEKAASGAVGRATELRVQMQSQQRMVLTYTRGEQVVAAVYIAYGEDIEKIVADERARREELFKVFTERGRLLSSSAYGSIRLQEGMRFVWEGYGRLGSQVFLKPVKGPGTVDFNYYLSKELAGQYDGVITFHFQEYAAGEGTSFLYVFDAAGVRLLFLEPANIQNLEAVRTGLSPLVVYFRFGNP
jgi:hypothetical protein